jgi:hypothetical protein
MCEDLNGSSVKSPVVVTLALERDVVLSTLVDRRSLCGLRLAIKGAGMVGVIR